MASALEVKHRFREGSTDAVRRYTLTEDGAAKDLTGFTAVKLYATRQSDGTDIGPITGSIVSPQSGDTKGCVDVDHTLVAATKGNYYAELVTTQASGDEGTEEVFLLLVRRKASDMDT